MRKITTGIIKKVKIKSWELGIVSTDGEFQKVLTSGSHSIIDFARNKTIEIFDLREGFFTCDNMDILMESNLLNDYAIFEKVQKNEILFVWKAGELTQVLTEGLYAHWAYYNDYECVKFDRDRGYLEFNNLRKLRYCELAKEYLDFVEIEENQRMLIWKDNQFQKIRMPGLIGIWKNCEMLKYELCCVESAEFTHKQKDAIIAADQTGALEIVCVGASENAIVFEDGKHISTLTPGRYAYWKTAKQRKVEKVSLKEVTADMPCQEIMTADKVTLRLNTLLSYRVCDPLMSVTYSSDAQQSLYRVGQIALRELVATRTLDQLLEDKNALSEEWKTQLEKQISDLGLELLAVGIRDVILPGEMKQLLNKVTEAKKAAEANLITRREETAALRSQANSAKLIESSPGLMKLKELETIQEVAKNGNLKVILGDNTLVDQLKKIV